MIQKFPESFFFLAEFWDYIDFARLQVFAFHFHRFRDCRETVFFPCRKIDFVIRVAVKYILGTGSLCFSTLDTTMSPSKPSAFNIWRNMLCLSPVNVTFIFGISGFMTMF
jgi:hypothetical protein